MPKINIYDKDYSRPALDLDTNLLTVAIPGFVANMGSFKAFADVNGVYCCNNATDFMNIVGIVEYDGTAQGRVFATLAKNDAPAGSKDIADYTYTTYYDLPDSEGNRKVHSGGLTEKEFNTLYGRVYVYSDKATEDATGYVPVVKSYKLSTGENPDYTILDGYYKLTLATDYAVGDDEAHAVKYVVLGDFAGSAGRAEVTEADSKANMVQIGNQLAYRLIRAGYTVYYKGITSLDELKHTEPTAQQEDSFGLDAFADKSSYDFRYILSGLQADSTGLAISEAGAHSAWTSMVNNVIDIAIDRKDCIALADIDNASLSNYHSAPKKVSLLKGSCNGAEGITRTSYAAIFAPSCVFPAIDGYKVTTLPASYYYLTSFAANIAKGYDEWYANAGELRGVNGDSILQAKALYGDPVINILEPRTNEDGYEYSSTAKMDTALNLIANFRGVPTLWGNRTAAKLEADLTYSQFLNVRQIVVTLSKTLYKACRRFTFDPNSDILWINFTTAITPLLERMKANEGIRDYKIIKIATDKKAYLKAKVRIVPIEAVEDFDIEISLEDSLATVTA